MAQHINKHEDAKLRRKINKPLVEKRRRERINKYLYELHSLLADAGSAPPASKLEKADILEMAVNHIKNLKRQIRIKYSNTQYKMPKQTDNSIPIPGEPLQIRIPSRSHSPADSVSSNNSDYPPSPSLNQLAYNPVVPSYHSAILQVNSGALALVLRGSNTTSTTTCPTNNSTSSATNTVSSKPMWRPW